MAGSFTVFSALEWPSSAMGHGRQQPVVPPHAVRMLPHAVPRGSVVTTHPPVALTRTHGPSRSGWSAGRLAGARPSPWAVMSYGAAVTVPEPVPEASTLAEDPPLRSEHIDLTRAIKRCRTWRELRRLYWTNRTRQGVVNVVSYFTRLAALVPDLPGLLAENADEPGDGNPSGGAEWRAGSQGGDGGAGKPRTTQATGERWQRVGRQRQQHPSSGRRGASPPPWQVQGLAERAALRQLVVRLVYDACSFMEEQVVAARLDELLQGLTDPWDTEAYALYLAEVEAAERRRPVGGGGGGWVPPGDRQRQDAAGAGQPTNQLPSRQQPSPRPLTFWEWLRDRPELWIDPVASSVTGGVRHWNAPAAQRAGDASLAEQEAVLTAAARRRTVPLCYGPLELATLAWAAARLQLHRSVPEHAAWLLHDLLYGSYRQMPEFDGRQLAQLAYSLTQLGPWVPPARWRRRFLAAARRRMAEMDPQSLANLTHSLEPLEMSPDPAWLRQLLVVSGPLLEGGRLSAAELTQLGWAVFNLRRRLCHVHRWANEVLQVSRIVVQYGNGSAVPSPSSTSGPEVGLLGSPRAGGGAEVAVLGAEPLLEFLPSALEDAGAPLPAARLLELRRLLSQPPAAMMPATADRTATAATSAAAGTMPVTGGAGAATVRPAGTHVGSYPPGAMRGAAAADAAAAAAAAPAATRHRPSSPDSRAASSVPRTEAAAAAAAALPSGGGDGARVMDAVVSDPWVSGRAAAALLDAVGQGGQAHGLVATWLLSQPPLVFLMTRLWGEAVLVMAGEQAGDDVKQPAVVVEDEEEEEEGEQWAAMEAAIWRDQATEAAFDLSTYTGRYLAAAEGASEGTHLQEGEDWLGALDVQGAEATAPPGTSLAAAAVSAGAARAAAAPFGPTSPSPLIPPPPSPPSMPWSGVSRPQRYPQQQQQQKQQQEQPHAGSGPASFDTSHVSMAAAAEGEAEARVADAAAPAAAPLLLVLHTRCWPGPRWLAALAAASTAQLHSPTFRAQSLGMLLWSLAGLGYSPPPGWLQPWLARAADLAPDFRPPNLVSVLCALSAWGELPPDRPAAALRAVAVRLLPVMDGRELQLTASALAQLCELPPTLPPPPKPGRGRDAGRGRGRGRGGRGGGGGGGNGLFVAQPSGGGWWVGVGQPVVGVRGLANAGPMPRIPGEALDDRGDDEDDEEEDVGGLGFKDAGGLSTSLTPAATLGSPGVRHRCLDPRVGKLLVQRAIEVSYSYSPRHMTRMLQLLALRLGCLESLDELGALLYGHAAHLEGLVDGTRRRRRPMGQNDAGLYTAAAPVPVPAEGSMERSLDGLLARQRELRELVAVALDAVRAVASAELGPAAAGAMSDEEAAAALPGRWWRAYLEALESVV